MSAPLAVKRSASSWSTTDIADATRLAWRNLKGLRPGSPKWFLYTLARNTVRPRPVFVVGVPRSGSTSLLVVLNASNHLGAPPAESHPVWLAFHHPRRSEWSSEAVGRGSVRRGEERFAKAYFASYANVQRVLDKTPANSLRLPHILELFPDAHVVVMRRNPCDVINSIINGWKVPDQRFASFIVPKDLRIPDYPRRRLWNFALPPDWRNLVGRSLPEIAFAQWDRISAAIEQARVSAPLTSRWTDVHLERLMEDPYAAMATLCGELDIPLERSMEKALTTVNRDPANALSDSAVGIWREENREAIEQLLPAISAASSRRGYTVDSRTGDFQITVPPHVALG